MAQNTEDSPILIAQTGPLNGQRWSLHESIIVGRDESCDIVVPSRQVSRCHARFTAKSQGTQLEDLGSKNGTHCNGKIIEEIVTLQDGDIIQIALAQQFLYVSSDATMPLDSDHAELLFDQQRYRLRLDKRSRRVWIGSDEVLPPLSVSQYNLLELLYDRQGRVVHRKELIEVVWGEEDAVGVSEQALDALVRRLRDRLAAIDPTHTYIVTVRGHGLRLENSPEE
ncbi:MAG: FHA domain-containing protein [Chloroflexota bacterium]|nr:MAG: FHA domain-containing protein [Chloroflexota bacterium]